MYNADNYNIFESKIYIFPSFPGAPGTYRRLYGQKLLMLEFYVEIFGELWSDILHTKNVS